MSSKVHQTLMLASAMMAATANASEFPHQAELSQAAKANDVIVIGKRRDLNRTLSQIRAISLSHDGQLARFETLVCPVVIGLPKEQETIVEARIREVAGLGGVAVDKPGCSPNLTVVVTDDGTTFVNQLHRKRPFLFDSLELHDLEALLRWRGPSWTWQSISPRRRDGGPVEMIDQLQFGDGPPRPVSRGTYIVHNADLSLLSMPVRHDTNLAFVVLDSSAINGHMLRQVADYAAMVGLAAIQTNNAGKLQEASILTLFDDAANGRAGQQQVTSFDLSYLTSLYSGSPGLSNEQKTGAIATQIDHRAKQ